MVGVVVAQKNVELIILEVVDHPIQPSPSIQGDAQIGDGLAGGVPQLVGSESTRTQDNQLHGQILL